MIYHPADFPWATMLADNWMAIREEFIAAYDPASLEDDEIYESGWDVLGLQFDSRPIQSNRDACPVTTALIDKIPGMTSAAFSLLRPESHITSHHGEREDILRFHLGLIVPEGCAIRVGSVLCPWVQGGVLIFDDNIEHEAWNTCLKISRALLLVDFLRPSPCPDPIELETLPFLN